MKKKLLTAAIMAALTVSTATALAAPVITGDAQTMIQTTRDSRDYTDTRLRLNFDFDLGDGMYAHSRIMGIEEQNGGSYSQYQPAGTGSSGAGINMEQLYIGAKLGQVDAKFGRQPVSVGKSILADINGVEGVSVATNAGNVSFFGFGGRSAQDDVLAADVNAKLDTVNLGAGFLKREDNKYWSVDAGTKINDVGLSAIYVTNKDADANGYMLKAAVGDVAKKGDFGYAVSYRDIDKYAVDDSWVTNGALADSKGFRLEAKYKPTESSTLWVYQDITKQASNESFHPNQFRAELDFNF